MRTQIISSLQLSETQNNITILFDKQWAAAASNDRTNETLNKTSKSLNIE